MSWKWMPPMTQNRWRIYKGSPDSAALSISDQALSMPNGLDCDNCGYPSHLMSCGRCTVPYRPRASACLHSQYWKPPSSALLRPKLGRARRRSPVR